MTDGYELYNGIARGHQLVHLGCWAHVRRQRLRERYSAQILVGLQALLLAYLPTVVPSSLLGRALLYMQEQWAKLIRFVENGNWPLSNNLCENAIRPWVVGRKGWLFADTVAGAHASANLYSLIETARTNGCRR